MTAVTQYHDDDGKVDVRLLLVSLTQGQRLAIADAIRAVPIAKDWEWNGEDSVLVDDAGLTLEHAATLFRPTQPSDSIFS